MLPQEAADILIDELASDRYIMNFRVFDNRPAMIDGQAGFKMIFTHKDKKGIRFKTLYYGFINGNFFYNLRYCAARRHYYKKDLADFKKIVNSFKLVNSNATQQPQHNSLYQPPPWFRFGLICRDQPVTIKLL